MGYHYRELDLKVDNLRDEIKKKAEKKEEPTPEKSALYDPYSLEARMKAEHDALMEKLNG